MYSKLLWGGASHQATFAVPSPSLHITSSPFAYLTTINSIRNIDHRGSLLLSANRILEEKLPRDHLSSMCMTFPLINVHTLAQWTKGKSAVQPTLAVKLQPTAAFNSSILLLSEHFQNLHAILVRESDIWNGLCMDMLYFHRRCKGPLEKL